MDRRRGGHSSKPPTKTRPPTGEEVQFWGQTLTAIGELSRVQNEATSSETINKMNKLMTTIPQEENAQAEAIEHLKGIKSKLTTGLNEVKSNAEAESRAIEAALEQLKALIRLREGVVDNAERRNKRPSSTPSSPRLSAYNPASGSQYPVSTNSVSSGGRSSQGPAPMRDPKAKREWLASQLPLQPGRMVAFRQPPNGKNGGRGGPEGGMGDADGETWIRAVVKRYLDNKRYEVQDEDTEDGAPGQEYKTTIKNLFPLPDPGASPTSPAHPNLYDEYPAGSSVLGLYPDTSCFYRAIVIAGPKDPPISGARAGNSGKSQGMYRLRFEDDEDQVRAVGVQWVVQP